MKICIIFIHRCLRMRLLTVFAIAVFPWCQVAAHDLWLENAGTTHMLWQGHRHATHAGDEKVEYSPHWVEGADCLGREGWQSLPVGLSYPVSVVGDCAVLRVSLASGYWTKTAWGTKNVPKTGLTGVIRSWHAVESIKRILRWTPLAAKPQGRGLELTALRDPALLAIGDKLRLFVTLDGKALPGVPVAYGDDVRGVTDAGGQIAIRIRRPGVQHISTSIELPLQDDKADIAIRSASLQFEIAQ